MTALNGWVTFPSDEASERIDWSTEVTEELGWQTATRRKPNRNQNSVLRPTAASFEPKNIAVGHAVSPLHSTGHTLQASRRGSHQQNYPNKSRKFKQSCFDNSRPISILNENAESQQGNMRGKRLPREDTKGFSNIVESFSNGHKKLASASRKEKFGSETNRNTGKDFKSTSKQGKRSEKCSEDSTASQEYSVNSGDKGKQFAPRSISILLRKSPIQQVEFPSRQSKKAMKQTSGETEEETIDEGINADQATTEALEKRELAVTPIEVTSGIEAAATAFIPHASVKLSFGDASQIEGALSPPFNNVSGRNVSKKRPHISNAKATRSLKRKALREAVSLPPAFNLRESTESAAKLRTDIRFGANNMIPVKIQPLSGCDHLNPSAPMSMHHEQQGQVQLDKDISGDLGFTEEFVGHKAVLEAQNKLTPSLQCQILSLAEKCPTSAPETQHTPQVSPDTHPELPTEKKSVADVIQDHFPPPSEWPTFVPCSIKKTPDTHNESNTAANESQENGKTTSFFQDTPKVDTIPGPSVPTLETLKGHGGLIPFLPQHCQPLYANGQFPDFPPTNPPPGFMFCVDEPEKFSYVSGAFIEPSIDQELFPDVNKTEPYALVLVLVKQIMFTLVDDNENGGEMTSVLLEREVTRLVNRISSGVTKIRPQDVRVLFLHDVRTSIFPNMMERDFTKFLDGASRRVGTCVVYHPLENMESFVKGKLEQAAIDSNCIAIVGVGSYWNETLPHDISTEIALLHQEKKCIPAGKVLAVVHDAFYDDTLTIAHPNPENVSGSKVDNGYFGSFFVFRRHWPKIFAAYHRINRFESRRYRIDDNELLIQKILSASKRPCFDYFIPNRLELFGLVQPCTNGDNCIYSHQFNSEDPNHKTHELDFFKSVLLYIVNRPTCHEHYCRDIYCRFNHDPSKSWNNMCDVIYEAYHKPSFPYRITIEAVDGRTGIICGERKK